LRGLQGWDEFAGGEDSGYFALGAGNAGSNPAAEKSGVVQTVEHLVPGSLVPRQSFGFESVV
jgi:hypothetical protein